MNLSIHTHLCRLCSVLVLLLLVSACGNDSEDNTRPEDELNVSVTEPVDRDFEAIKQSGTLRMITRYSSNTYFLHQGLEYGFEYELLKEFANEHDLALDVVVVEPGQNPYDMLNSGKGDVIAANYTITPVRQRYVSFTHPYNLVDQVLVFSGELENPPDSISRVAERNIPISVRQNSSYYQQLQRLKKAGYKLRTNLVSNNKDTESLLFDISRGRHMATIADDNILQASENYMDNLLRGPVVAESDTIAWAVRSNATKLKKRMNGYLSSHFRLDEDTGEPKRSAFLNVLRRRYFERGPQIEEYYSSETPGASAGVISPYDEIFREVADSVGIDWLMLAAITAQETKFNPKAKSWTGAVGLMQVLPRYSEVEEVGRLYEVRTNIREGARIISEHLDHYAYMDSTDQWQFALAAYNAGQGHVADARRLVIDFNKDPNSWEHTADALLKLMDRTYYQNARYGFCRGIETVNYVKDVTSRRKTYQSILAMADSGDTEGWPGVLGIFQ